ncbi:tetratricopeptide repeat protein [Aureimonas psammosilenae]|uniref:tetratricopeptide repeat protein n=1 Tax=Aureimonas psammosilenae TaxID=2495496 RepID=UPI001260C5CE|nr:hypothetical protein [Aureimonas psammosilenae]
MPAIKSLTLSASLLVLAFAGTALASSPAAPDFGGASVSAPSASPAAPVFAAPAPVPASAPSVTRVPAALAIAPPPVSVAPVTPGVNPFSAPVAAAPAPTAASPAPGNFQPVVDPASATDEKAAEGAVDEAALRYYASTRDLVRVGAEIRRLKTLHPEWQPPADLFAKNEKADESDLWALFSRKDFAGLDAAIAAKAKAMPGWQPSADLKSKMEVERARFEMGGATARGDWASVVAAAERSPGALTCPNIDLLWSLGEAYARLGNNARAFDAYAYLLKSCEDPGQRLATYQKAAQLLPKEGAEALAGFGRPLPNGSTEFASLRFDELRGQIGKVAAGESLVAPDLARLQAFAADIAQSRSQGDALLMGWYLYAQNDYAGAADWFRAASRLGDDPKATEGTILALRGDGKTPEAETLARENRTRSPEFAKIYVELLSSRLTENDASATLGENEMRDFSEAVERSKSALGAQSLGWNYLAKDKLEDARAWFAKSVGWQATKEGVTGLAVIAARSKNKGELKEITDRFGDSFPELASLQVAEPRKVAAKAQVQAPHKGKSGGGSADASLMTQANAAFKERRYAEAISLLDKRQNLYGRNGGAEVLRGWANLKLGRYEEARRVFKAENSRRSTKDTRFGIGAVSNEQYDMWN